MKKNLSKSLRVLTCAIGLMASMSAISAPVQWTTASGGNGHWYDIIISTAGGGFTWDGAYADSLSRTYLGMQGYMATVTSVAENSFLYNNIYTGTAWAGGNDRQSEGVWKWVTGPEAGQIFYGPGAPSGAYSNWNSGEPNNISAGENDLVLNWSGMGWNDYGYPSFPNALLPYFIEYSESTGNRVPEPASLALLGLGLVGICFSRRKR